MQVLLAAASGPGVVRTISFNSHFAEKRGRKLIFQGVFGFGDVFEDKLTECTYILLEQGKFRRKSREL
jgi:hypothetical protein